MSDVLLRRMKIEKEIGEGRAIYVVKRGQKA